MGLLSSNFETHLRNTQLADMKQEDIPADSWKLLENPRPSLVEKITLNRPHKILGRTS